MHLKGTLLWGGSIPVHAFERNVVPLGGCFTWFLLGFTMVFGFR